ncbi:MAG: hypothetical protein ACOCRX_07875 [Candidatus Woesearchaeota archaeon]
MEVNNNKKYKNGTLKTLQQVEQIIKDLKIKKDIQIKQFEELFEKTSQEITTSWDVGRKYSRTLFMQKAFEDDFPEKYLNFSLAIDVMINILDDFFDEDLNEQRRKIYVIEFLRNFSFYSKKNPNEEIKELAGNYMIKLITLAFCEHDFEDEIKKSSDLKEIIDLSFSLLKTRSMDIDIFAEIALIENQENKEEIKSAARLFRSLNILKKDLIDIPYDKKNGIETAVTVVEKKDIPLQKYVKYLVSKIFEEVDWNRDSESRPLSNFYKMMEDEEDEIIKLSNLL